MITRLLTKLSRRRRPKPHEELVEEERLAREAQQERHRAEARMAEQRQRIEGSGPSFLG